MRGVWIIVLACVAGCASEKLAMAPPSGVDFSGRWQLNDADSDDPQRVALSQNTAVQSGSTATGTSGGRGGGRGGRAGPGGVGGGGPAGPVMPGMGALSDGLRWPGKQLDVRQAAGVVTITSLGTTQVYRPAAGPPSKHHQQASADAGAPGGRDPRARDRGDGPPPLCGWDDKTLVVRSENPDDDHPPFEERYSVSSDGRRLVEVVAFTRGRSGGFTVSRVWDRVVPDGTADAGSGAAGTHPPP